MAKIQVLNPVVEMDGDKIIFEYNASNDSKVTFTLRLIDGPVEPVKKNSNGLVVTHQAPAAGLVGSGGSLPSVM